MPKPRNKKSVSYEEWVAELVDNLAIHFNLIGWQISIDHCADPKEQSDCGETYAHIRVVSPYQLADMTFFKSAKQDFENKNVSRLVQATVHELVHIFLDPFSDWMVPHLSQTTQPLFGNTVENQTQKLTMVLLKNLPDSVIPAL